MMSVLQINTTVNSGSTGRIAEDIGKRLIDNGYKSYIAYGRGNRPSASNLIKIGTQLDVVFHGLETLLFDRHGLGSKQATSKFVKKIESINPNLIHLHNLHGYYINILYLFDFFLEFNKPIVWTLHDCWTFTGHCTFFDDIECKKWETACFSCPKKSKYPKSIFLDRSKQNFIDKRNLFTKIKYLTIVTPSVWLSKLVKKSFLFNHDTKVINNGIDINIFTPKNELHTFKEKNGISGVEVILGVASTWDKRKGLDDFIRLSEVIDSRFKIVLIGLSKSQKKQLPHHIIGIERTENIEELAMWYSAATVFVNPTYQDNFPTTNIEALASGTPVITYDSGGSSESIDETTGVVVKKGQIDLLYQSIKLIQSKTKNFYQSNCRERAIKMYNKEERYQDYITLYKKILRKN